MQFPCQNGAWSYEKKRVGLSLIYDNCPFLINGKKSLKYLSQVGQWVLDASTKIGSNVAAAAIKESLDLN